MSTKPKLSKNPNKSQNATTPTDEAGADETLNDSLEAGAGEGESDGEGDEGSGPTSEKPADEPLDSSTPESELEAEKAKKTQHAAYRAGKEARARALASQQADHGGQVNDMQAADQAGKDAFDEVLDGAKARRGRGVYVKSQVVLTGDDGNRLTCPEGMRLTEKMVNQMGEKELKRLKRDRILDDFR